MKERTQRYGYLFVAPFVLAFLMFQAYPILYTLVLSFTKFKVGGFAGLSNYQHLLGDKTFWLSVSNTWVIWLGCFIPQVVFALLLAVMLSQYKLRGAGLFRAVFYLPNLVTAASIGILFGVLMDWQTGVVNRLLLQMGVIGEPVNWMGTPVTARSLTSFIQWWMWFGYSTIIITAGIKAISGDVIEASIVDGANSTQRFFRITLPLIQPTMVYVMVTSLIGGMQIFDIPMVLTGGDGKPQKALMTMALYVYNTAFRSNNYAYGSTVSYGIFVIILVFTLIFFRVLSPAGNRRDGGSQ